MLTCCCFTQGCNPWEQEKQKGERGKEEEAHAGVGTDVTPAWFHYDELLDHAGLSSKRLHEEPPLRKVPPGGEREKNSSTSHHLPWISGSPHGEFMSQLFLVVWCLMPAQQQVRGPEHHTWPGVLGVCSREAN